MRASLTTLFALGLLVVGSSCAPTTRSAADADRLERTEKRLTELERRIADVERVGGLMTAISSGIEQIIDRISSIEERLGDVTSRVDARPAPRRPSRARPDPALSYSVPVDGNPFEGPANAKVTIIKGFEFACPFCNKARPTMDEIRKEYGKDVRIVYKHFIVHPTQATLPAQAACAANKQGKFKKLYDLLWSDAFEAGRNFSQANLERLAKKTKLNMKKFRRDMQGDCKKLVRADQAELAKVGMTGTPGFFINGRFLSGARPIDQFRPIIDDELAKANDAIKNKKVKQADYYDHIVKNGVKAVGDKF
jgi:protein-disulfide isomerase